MQAVPLPKCLSPSGSGERLKIGSWQVLFSCLSASRDHETQSSWSGKDFVCLFFSLFTFPLVVSVSVNVCLVRVFEVSGDLLLGLSVQRQGLRSTGLWGHNREEFLSESVPKDCQG